MGFHRMGMPASPHRARVIAAVTSLLSAEDLGFVQRTQDHPFLVDHDCINPAGHAPIISCGDIVCRHCAKVF